MTRWTTSLGRCMLAAVASATLTGSTVGTLAAQTTKKPQPKTTATAATTATTATTANKADHHPSTLDGLYTEAQARRGKDVYFGSCRSCHSAESHTGATF